MLLQAMIGKRSHLHAAGTNLCTGLRITDLSALALLLP
jgi:hypothetical protein